MGLLDDAIREHLELKRKQGAADEEIRRQQEEALGPVQRGPGPQRAAVGEKASNTAEEHEPPDSTSAEPVALEEPVATAHEPADLEESPDRDLHLQEPPGDHMPNIAETDYEDPEPEREPGETPPRGFDADEEAAPEDGDVLEDTPDFLQETPEHDRLWFEQKPPRDFDFD